MIVIKIMFYILLGLLLLPFLLLMVPIEYQGQGRYAPDEKQGSASIIWLWGLLGFIASYDHADPLKMTFRLAGFSFPLPAPNLKQTQKTPKTKAKEHPSPGEPSVTAKTETAGRKKDRFSGISIRSHMNRDVIKACLTYLKQILHNLKPEEFVLHLCFGLEDPFTTAQINNILMALWPLTHKCPVTLQPVFYESPLKAAGNISGKLIPITLLWTTLRFVFKKPIRTIWWTLFKHKMPLTT